MPKSAKAKKKITKLKTKIAAKPKITVKTPIKISKNYIPKDTENTCAKNIKYFLELSLLIGKKN